MGGSFSPVMNLCSSHRELSRSFLRLRGSLVGGHRAEHREKLPSVLGFWMHFSCLQMVSQFGSSADFAPDSIFTAVQAMAVE